MRWITELRGDQVLAILLNDGWNLHSKRGRQVLIAKEGHEPISFPLHPTIPLSKARVESIWKKADMTPERLFEIIAKPKQDIDSTQAH